MMKATTVTDQPLSSLLQVKDEEVMGKEVIELDNSTTEYMQT